MGRKHDHDVICTCKTKDGEIKLKLKLRYCPNFCPKGVRKMKAEGQISVSV